MSKICTTRSFSSKARGLRCACLSYKCHDHELHNFPDGPERGSAVCRALSVQSVESTTRLRRRTLPLFRRAMGVPPTVRCRTGFSILCLLCPAFPLRQNSSLHAQRNKGGPKQAQKDNDRYRSVHSSSYAVAVASAANMLHNLSLCLQFPGV